MMVNSHNSSSCDAEHPKIAIFPSEPKEDENNHNNNISNQVDCSSQSIPNTMTKTTGKKIQSEHSNGNVRSLKVALISIRQTICQFLKTYFWEGQELNDKAVLLSSSSSSTTRIASSTITTTRGENNDSIPNNNNNPIGNNIWFFRHRKWIAILVPALVVHVIWWSIMIRHDYFYLFVEPSGAYDKPRYYMSITMIFGSMVAGATSEGGGAVAFPVMTLALGITPPVARDFAFMIQSVGMVASAFTILVMQVAIEWKALLYVSFGGIAGIILGLEQVAPRLSPPYSKMYFVVIWSSFAIGLYLLNRTHDRVVHKNIQQWEQGILYKFSFGGTIHWKRETLILFGVLGGIFSAMSGSGIDICSFSVLTLLFRVSEKVATPTSVVLMAINTTIGFAYREFVMGGVEEDAWGFLAVCAPIVVIGAPVGAFFGSHWHRLALASIIYVIDAAQLIGALYVIQPWTTLKTDTPLHLCITSLALFLGGAFFFRLLSYLGLRLLEANTIQSHQDNNDDDDDDEPAVLATDATKEQSTMSDTDVVNLECQLEQGEAL